MVREISYARDGAARGIPWEDCTEEDKENVIDDNIPLTDNYCPICDDETQMKEVSDKINTCQGLTIRKRLFQCETCNYLFSHENKNDRSGYFVNTPYDDNLNNHRGQREVDLVNLAAKLMTLPKDAAILIYAVGKNKTREMLEKQGYTNVWSCDIVQGSNYGERFINIDETPDFFADHDIKFDIITAVEVWEHYRRNVVNSCFEWIFNQVSDMGIVVSTTSIWNPKNNDPYFNAGHEYGRRQLEWWFYPYIIDHVSFYTENNLSTIGHRYGFSFSFGYFQNKYVHTSDPWKRVIIAFRDNNVTGHDIITNKIHRKFHDISY